MVFNHLWSCSICVLECGMICKTTAQGDGGGGGGGGGGEGGISYFISTTGPQKSLNPDVVSSLSHARNRWLSDASSVCLPALFVCFIAADHLKHVRAQTNIWTAVMKLPHL